MQDFAKNSSQVELAESSDLPFSWSQNTVPLSQDGSTIYIEGLVWALFVNIVKKILDEYTYTVSFYFEAYIFMLHFSHIVKWNLGLPRWLSG